MYKTVLSTVIGIAVAAVPFAAPVAFAATTSTPTATVTATVAAPTLAQLQAEVQTLLVKVQALTAQLVKVKSEQQALVSSTIAITAQMHIGSRGKNVLRLQRLLATNPAIYPQKLVTGYFGRLTEAAVRRFQKNHGIEDVGDVGPQTRRMLNAYLSHATSTIPAHLLQEFETEGTATSTGTGTNTFARRQSFVAMCHNEGFSGKSNTIVVARPATFVHIERGDTIGACDSEGEHGQAMERRAEQEMGRGRSENDDRSEKGGRGFRGFFKSSNSGATQGKSLGTSAGASSQSSEGDN